MIKRMKEFKVISQITLIKHKLYFRVEDNKKNLLLKLELVKLKKYKIYKIFEDDIPYHIIYNEIINNCIKECNNIKIKLSFK